MMSGEQLWLVVDDTTLMNYLIFWSALFVGVPLGILLCRIFRPAMHFVFGLMIWATCEPEMLGISFVTREEYRASIRGFEVLTVDLCALVLLFTMMWRAREYPARRWLPLTGPYLIFFLVGLASWLVAKHLIMVPGPFITDRITVIPPSYQYFETQLYPLFELWRILRGFLVFWVTANFIRNENGLKTFISSIGFVLAYLTVFGLVQRYGYGMYRVQARMQHPNDFAVYCAMLGAVLMPLIFQSKRFFMASVFGVLALSAVVCEILTISRSGLIALILSIVAVAAYAVYRHFTVRNFILLGLGIFTVFLALVRSQDTLYHRFYVETTYEDTVDERTRYNDVAVRMAMDHPLGVGLGNFSAWSWEQYAKEVSPRLEPGVPAHNIWYLTFGELGFLGVIALALIWLRTYQVAYRAQRGQQDTLIGAVIFGVVVATLTLHIQSTVQFSYRSNSVYNLLQVMIGVLVGCYYLTLEQKSRKKKRAKEQRAGVVY